MVSEPMVSVTMPASVLRRKRAALAGMVEWVRGYRAACGADCADCDAGPDGLDEMRGLVASIDYALRSVGHGE